MCILHRAYLLAIGWSLIPLLSIAQSDSLIIQVSTLGGVSSQSYLPQWLVANRFGILDYDNDQVGLLRASAMSYFQLSERLRIEAGLDGVARTSFSELDNTAFLQQGYLKIRYGAFELMAGQMERTVGTPDESISSGSLAISSNARPMPQILLSIPEYAPVPFTKGYLEVKGTFAHGWFGEGRHISNAYLHEKSLYGRAGGKFPVNVYGGLAHFAIWGGETAGISIPDSFRDYLRVFMGGSAQLEEGNSLLPGEVSNAAGDHLGVYDLGITADTRLGKLAVYHQTLFEDASGNNPFNGDRLLGMHVTPENNSSFYVELVYEFLYTKYQSGPTRPGGPNDPPGAKDKYGGEFRGRDNYYNNYLYRSGWTYQDRIIGTPLFYTKSRMKLYDPTFVDPDEGGFNFNIVNNRVVAHHFGITGNYKDYWKYKLLATFSTNYGTYGGINGGINGWGSIENPDAPYAFRPPKNQQYFLTEIERETSSGFTFYVNIGIDVGEIYQANGILAGLRWEAHHLLSKKE